MTGCDSRTTLLVAQPVPFYNIPKGKLNIHTFVGKETLDKEEVAKIFEKLKRSPNRPAWTGSNKRKPSKKGPVKAPVRLVKPEDTKASLEHPSQTQKSSGAVANEVKNSKNK